MVQTITLYFLTFYKYFPSILYWISKKLVKFTTQCRNITIKMKFRYIFLLCLSVVSSLSVNAQGSIEFVQNRGQWGDWFKYKATTSRGDICLENDGFRYILGDPANKDKIEGFHHGRLRDPQILKFHTYKVTFEGANIPVIQGQKQMTSYYNYYLGNDSRRWKSGIHPYRDINYNKFYKGIDMHISSIGSEMVYELIAKPHADVAQIKIRFDGQDKLTIKDSNLIVNTSVGQVMEMKPYAYQVINDVRTEIPCYYKIDGNIVSFDFPQGYDRSKLLVIDPTVVFCTFTGSTADNWGYTATYDDSGYFYAGGLVNTLEFGGAYPVTPGAFQTTWGGGYGDATASEGYAYAADIAIMKFSPDGKNRIFATYLGGSGNEHPHSMIVDAGYNLIVAGRSMSKNYPVTASAYSTTNKGDWDIVITKFNSSGTALLASTYIGGSGTDGVNYDSTEYGYGQLKHNYGDDSRSEVQIDATGNIYVAGCTNSTDFPTTAGAMSTTLKGTQDGVVCKFNSTLSTLLWSTYVGGSNNDAAYVLAFDSLQRYVYLAGGTNSTDFPVTAGAWQTTYGGDSADGFILKFLNSPPYSLAAGTYIGTSGYDQVYGIQTDEQGGVYVMGQSIGGLFPVTAGTYSNPNSSQFVMKTDSNLATDVFSTVFGSGDATHSNISPVAFLVDTCYNIYVSGWGGNLGFTLPNSGTDDGMVTTPGAVQSTTDGRDFYFIVFSRNAASLIYATFYGRYSTDHWQGEHVDGGTSRFDKNGIIYQAICGNCCGYCETSYYGYEDPPLPTTPGVWAPIDMDKNCNEAALKIAFNIGPVTAKVSAAPSTSGCAPFTVNFSNYSLNGISYQWNFGDSSATDTTFNATHTYTAVGTYTVSLSANDSNACIRVTDTARLVITVGSSTITPAFNDAVTNNCPPYTVSFANTSSSGSTSATYTWYFGDGASYTGTTPPVHSYVDSGVYTVTLIMADPSACKTPDTITQSLSLFGDNNIIPDFNYFLKDSCPPYTVSLTNASIDTLTGSSPTYTWYYGDGATYSGTNPPAHNYADTGTVTISMVMTDASACKSPDTVSKKLSFPWSSVSARFLIPDSLCVNAAFTVKNNSVNDTGVSWNFGNGQTSNTTTPTYSYDTAGTYTVTLIANNAGTCNQNDTFTQTIKIFVGPTANFTFSPTLPVPNSPVSFINLSVNANRYLWNFGDGATDTTTNPNHMYSKTGTWNVCLQAFNNSGCPSQICKSVPTDIQPIVGLPTGFSPNGDGDNDILYVRGAAIQTLDLKIWNRWGQLVFETNDQNRGWDGTFNGQPQPIDAYAYVLIVTFIDGTSETKKGNITLLR